MARTQTCSNTLTDSAALTADFAQTNTAAGGNVLVDAGVGAYGQYGLQPTNQRASARYTGAGSPGASQFASAVLAHTPGGGDAPTQTAGVSVLGSGSGATRAQYEAWTVNSASPSAVTTALAKVVGNVVSILHTASMPWAAGDRIDLEADQYTTAGATILRVCKNGVPIGGAFTHSDTGSPLTSGAPGVVASGNQVKLSGWQAGTVSADVALTLGTPSAQSGIVGTAFSWAGAALSALASGGSTPYTFSIASGSLPAGLSLNASTGVVSGTPTTAGSGAAVFRVTDSLGATANSGSVGFAVAAAAATATTLSGPSGGQVGVASSVFTVGANGTIAGTVTVTPSDGGGGGTFAPTSVAISSSTPTATFTYTPASAGAKTISLSDNGGLADAAALAYTASSTTYSLTIGPFALNTGSGPLLSTAVSYTLWPGVDTGAVSGTPINGSGTTHATTGALSIAGLAAAGSYLVTVKNSDGSGRWNNVATAA